MKNPCIRRSPKGSCFCVRKECSAFLEASCFLLDNYSLSMYNNKYTFIW